MKKAPATVTAYIAAFPTEVQQLLNQMRKIISTAAPKAEESVSYGMPAYKYLGRPLVYFAGYDKHIGFYATPTGHDAFKEDLAKYKQGKGSVQFPLTEKLPVKLIERIVKFRVNENELKTAVKKSTGAAAKKTAAEKNNDAEKVKEWLSRLDPAQQKATNAVRKIIKAAGPQLNERIKWNAPSFYYKEDIVTFGPYKKNTVLLVFHHPAIVKIKSALLEGNYKDRRLLHLKDTKAISAAKKELERIIKEIILLLDK